MARQLSIGFPLLALAFVASSDPSVAQDFVRRITAPAGATRFGEILAVAGDVNGDASLDLLVGDPDHARSFVISGRDGSLLRTHLSPNGADRYGFACAGIGDLDLDGRADYAIGAPRSTGSSGNGAVYAYSGASGALLRTHVGASAGTEFGASVVGASDLDGDGWSDYVVGELFWGPAFAPPGRIHWFSGRNGAVLSIQDGHNGIGQMGYSVDLIGDVDGDRCADVLAAEPGFGQAVLYSGRDHSILRVEPWVFGFFFWGSVLAGVGDVNADGRSDYAIGTTDFVGLVRIVSGADGTTLREVLGTVAGAEFGSAVIALGDVDLDGNDDYAIGASLDATGGTGSGRVAIHSGRTGATLGFVSGAAGDELGSALASLGDADGDGWRELAIGRPGANAVDLHSLRFVGNPAITRLAVHGCPSSMGDLPRLREIGEPRLGSPMVLRVTGGRPSPVAAVNLGVEWNLDLGPLAPGCLVHAYPLAMLGVPLDATGAIDVSYPLPNDASYVGLVLAWQALTIDPANNPLGIASSNGLATRLGIPPRSTALGTLGGGVRGVDSATGIGYLMFTSESVATRFAANPVTSTAARNLVAVRWDGATSTWGYALDSSYVTFVPRASDVLLAQLDFGTDTVTLLAGRFSVVQGIAAGYVSSDLVVTPNRYAGSSNSGEFEVGGTQFTR